MNDDADDEDGDGDGDGDEDDDGDGDGDSAIFLLHILATVSSLSLRGGQTPGRNDRKIPA